LDYFGWCTWDAFYTDVDVDGVHSGLESLAAGGTPARFLIIDDGWQSTGRDTDSDATVVTVGTQYASRLTDICENQKFKRLKGATAEDKVVEFGEVVQEMKSRHDLRLCGDTIAFLYSPPSADMSTSGTPLWAIGVAFRTTSTSSSIP